ncbi:glycosyltransferase family 39 protein [Candidatus Woesearchaeota archaeon]|nr:glycosyltransferase family 39 protein [Candidatus Woesearchaeota archaeon]
MDDATKKYLIIGGILLLAVAVRLYGLTAESIWFDEAFSIYVAQQPASTIMSLPDTNPPLHILGMSFLVKLFGATAFWARLPSVLFGAGAVLFSYLVFKKIFGEKTAVISALIVALSSYHIIFSQEARMYAMLGFMALLSMHAYISYLQTPTRKTGMYYTAATILLAFTHVYGLLLILTQNIFYYMIYRKYQRSMKHWALMQIIVFIFYLQWLPTLLQQAALVQNSFWLSHFQTASAIFLPLIFSGELLLGAVLTALAALAIWKLFRTQRNPEAELPKLVLLWMTVPAIVAVAYSILATPVFLHKYVMYSSFPFYAFAAHAAGKLPQPKKWGVMGIIIGLSFFAILYQAQNTDNDNWSAALSHVQSIDDGSTVIVNPPFQLVPFMYYYDKECFSQSYLYNCARDKRIFTSRDWTTATDTLSHSEKIVVVDVTFPGAQEPDIAGNLSKTHVLTSEQRFEALPSGSMYYSLKLANGVLPDVIKSIRERSTSTITVREMYSVN